MSQPSPIIRLPAEILDVIFQSLDTYDHTSFRNCSLTCRAWLPFSRTRLFRILRPGFGHRTFAHLDEILRTSPDTGPYVKELFTSPTSLEHFVALALRFGAVETLTLCFYGPICTPHASLAALGPVRRLSVHARSSMDDKSREGCTALAEFVALFPMIDNFGLFSDSPQHSATHDIPLD
ncbi:hypothetical protein OBBRIDRAFT_886129 [Obba rivulosa]|uniref:F-box domain-containing protein n=1 Tax=Obba rivulosa TaxID=1052685 RepID=A0A8E2AY16_9APHY|nr:hypothetical protein OBBRIDRAFT_886129 [Obba rivulosa]